MPKLPHDVTISGAGIAGLTAGILLARAGRQVTIFERREELTAFGAGIQITPNGSAILQVMDLLHGADRARCIEIREGEDVLYRLKLSDRNGYFLFHRGDLIRKLLHAASEAGVTLRLGSEIVNTAATATEVRCAFADGNRHIASYVIAADGVSSPMRQMRNPGSEPVLCDHCAWRGQIVSERDEFASMQGIVQLVIGAAAHMVIYPLRKGSRLNVVVVTGLEQPRHLQRPREVTTAEIGSALNGFEEAKYWLGRCRGVWKWLLPRPFIARNWYHDRVVIIGDALHPMPPFLAQGGNMALEDAWLLCRCLLDCDDVGDAHARFRQARQPRLNRIIRSVELQGQFYHADSVPVKWGRRWLLRAADRTWPSLLSDRLRWIYDTDLTRDGS
ncbi:MAG: NAD(P)/FAD-dependent oxidoreductase [Rhodobacteraceae bacterium]|nr:NAD(P)/FAD-dependent oxidoreductase [Paracoccaceae bacterium]